ncbi:hypothetical protein RF11_07495 [Thelohanellus kitauei]|uniref:Uncharacterized protein n=1 Tax=Thelohanellus kitauei TaxID=669202 RepID=A0A0C2IH76_THEKT|nr:hypothetical protein RF11_07495 [Thelohanellus kitauei]
MKDYDKLPKDLQQLYLKKSEVEQEISKNMIKLMKMFTKNVKKCPKTWKRRSKFARRNRKISPSDTKSAEDEPRNVSQSSSDTLSDSSIRRPRVNSRSKQSDISETASI